MPYGPPPQYPQWNWPQWSWPIQTGWACPRCGQVISPLVTQCPNHPTITTSPYAGNDTTISNYTTSGFNYTITYSSTNDDDGNNVMAVI